MYATDVDRSSPDPPIQLAIYRGEVEPIYVCDVHQDSTQKRIQKAPPARFIGPPSITAPWMGSATEKEGGTPRTSQSWQTATIINCFFLQEYN